MKWTIALESELFLSEHEYQIDTPYPNMLLTIFFFFLPVTPVWANAGHKQSKSSYEGLVNPPREKASR